ncbi:MAG: penicillin acylase family protein [Dehalococcoidia bacterium]
MTNSHQFGSATARVDGIARAPGLHGQTTIRRDAHGIPHIDAPSEHDAWFAMGYACAQDRLWQMEWYRRRGTGRWAEVAGASAVETDALFRRFDLERASRQDDETMSPETLAMFQAYAEGVNAFLSSGEPLPVEFEITGVVPEPWEPWHSTLAFRVRHVLMGQFQWKLARLRLLFEVGPERFAIIDGRDPVGSPVILPPGGRVPGQIASAADELARIAAELGPFASDDGGSNSWAVHGSRTTTGKPVICNDSHRPLDVPNVYWQAHVACPSFNVAGATFAGFPAFPHFGYNGHVAWNITHGVADTQDLYIEEFDPEDPHRYRTRDGWTDAEVEPGEVLVRAGDPVPCPIVRTRHGSIVVGDHTSGHAIAMRWTATDRPNRQWECLRPMLTARSVTELHESQRLWVDPVNNLVSADREGSIGYLTRGRLPIRSNHAGRQFPVAGWTGDAEWTGDVPFEQLPQAIDPAGGIIVTANQRIIEGDEPYISHEFAPGTRAERILEALAHESLAPGTIIDLQGDTISVMARRWARFLGDRPGMTGDAERARAMLAAWDGNLRADSAEALLYAAFRREVAAATLGALVGDNTWAWLTRPGDAAATRIVSGWMARTGWSLDASPETTPAGQPWADVLPGALERAWAEAWRVAGSDDPVDWHWGDHHLVTAEHTLSPVYPDRADVLDPPAFGIGGDGDTVQVASMTWRQRAPFTVTGLSVYRQVVDFAEPDRPSWVIPGGATGSPGTPHYGDQVDHWREHRRMPMPMSLDDVRAAAHHALVLIPA